MGASILLWPNPRKNPEKTGKWGKRGKGKFGIFHFFIIFSMIFWPKSIPEPPGSIADHSGKVRTSPDLNRPISHVFFKKKMYNQIRKIAKIPKTRFSIFWRIQASGPWPVDQTSSCCCNSPQRELCKTKCDLTGDKTKIRKKIRAKTKSQPLPLGREV